ncbi:MAG TPA: hypothetical protein VKG43_14520, partial [Acidimicrobiales bacterium]|nr:hypothetical protein [Acidimicrobiales bacterium]
WPTTDGTLTAQATGGAVPITYGQVVASGHPIYWDPVTNTAWTSYQDGRQWHEDFFENPQSLYLEAQLAQFFGLDGVGIWALGFEGRDESMISALDGFAPPLKATGVRPTQTVPTTGRAGRRARPLPLPGPAPTTTTSTPSLTTTTTTPPPTTTTTTAPPTYAYSGTWQGQGVVLTRVEARNVHGDTELGQLTGFSTTDPAVACLTGTALSVYQSTAAPGTDVVVARTPGECARATFTFSSAAAGNAPSGPSP